MRRLLAPVALAALVLLAGCGVSAPPTTHDEPAFDAPAAEQPVDPADETDDSDETDPAPPAMTYAAGSAFDETCSVAWPSAPVVSANDIQLTVACPGVPSDYPLVLVVYGDPSLPVTPSTGSFRVVGEVYGSDVTQAGLPYLIVIASTITL